MALVEPVPLTALNEFPVGVRLFFTHHLSRTLFEFWLDLGERGFGMSSHTLGFLDRLVDFIYLAIGHSDGVAHFHNLFLEYWNAVGRFEDFHCQIVRVVCAFLSSLPTVET